MNIEQTCWCGKKFMAKSADVKRGWAKSCSKAHAAHARELKLDRFGYKHGNSAPVFDDANDDNSWDSHKEWI